jgi:predicted metal-binding membrane protein
MSAELIAEKPATMRIGRAPIVWPWLLVAIAWLLALTATVTNRQYLLNHHWLMEESGLPWPIAMLVFLGIWQVMMVAMMLPSSMPALYKVTYASRNQARHRTMPAWFLAGYLAVWTGFALVAVVADIGEQLVADVWPWLGIRPWLIGAITLAVAGIFQFSPLKERFRNACHSRFGIFMRACRSGEGPTWRLGLRFGLLSVGCAWALMLVMFGVDIGSVAGMAGLTALMVIEEALPGRLRVVPAVGIVCLVLAVLWLAHPAWLLRSAAGAPLAAPANAMLSGQTHYSGGYAITLHATPAKPGTNVFVVTLGNSHKDQIAQAQVVIDTTMLDMEMGTEQVLLQPAAGSEPGIYEGRSDLTMPGHWELVVHVQPAHAGQPIQAVFLLMVT